MSDVPPPSPDVSPAAPAEGHDPRGLQAPVIISLRGLNKVYETGDTDLQVLFDINLEIREGEFVAIMGPSGSGKSTLMNLLGLMDSPSSGTYELAGVDVTHLSPDEHAIARGQLFGFIFQRYNLLSNESARENAGMPALYSNLSAASRHDRAEELLTQLGLGHRLDHRPSHMSGGEQQRVAIARALMNGGRIILADEPTGALDSKNGRDVMEFLHTLHAGGRTVILITHDPNVAAEARRIIRIHDGRIISDEPSPTDFPPMASAPVLEPIRLHWSRGSLLPLRDIAEAVKMGMRSLRANIFRTFLTMLGIIIGVGSVVAMLNLGVASRQEQEKWFKKMGTNLMRIGPSTNSRGAWGALNFSDAKLIADIPGVLYSVPMIYEQKLIRHGNQSTQTTVSAVGRKFQESEDRIMLRGTFFTQEDVENSAAVAVLGLKTAMTLFPDSDPLGQYILVGNTPFQVIGVMTVSGGQGKGQDREDDVICIPISTGIARLYGNKSLSQISVKIGRIEDVTPLQDQITEALKSAHGDMDFRVFNQAAILESYRQSARMWNILLGSIGAISLLVGGIGVMNIMLVNVVERTREIGVRMACGARSSDIQMQFLAEAVVVCLLGGVLGLGLGVGLSYIAPLMKLPVVITPLPMILAFACAFVTGVIFGFWPARKASKLNPVVALSAE
ncbi:MAG: MacB family efflux pump subunit [Verrucomicrobiae bacterium]|nr:MacB family efflux pump subunit [Verrucomicrobiae bacterium]